MPADEQLQMIEDYGETLEPGERWLDAALERLRHANRFRQLRVRESPHVSGMVQLDGRSYLDFGSNDYLGLAADPALVEAVQRAVREKGWGSGASPLVSGYGVYHRRLEQEIASFEGVESAVLFPTGFAANVSAITSLCEAGDLILSDAMNHASIIDGCRLSGAQVKVYRHSDMQQLEELLRERRQYRRGLIVTDGLFSMDGDFAPLNAVAELAERFDCMLMVDEAHATGVFGELGRGSAELMGIEQATTVRVGTLSKALGSIGGFVAGSRKMTDWIRNRGRSYMFSTALPEAAAVAGIEAIRLVQSNPGGRTKLGELIAKLHNELRLHGISVPKPATSSPHSQIVPVIVGSETAAMDACNQLMEQGIFVPAIRPPTVPEGACRLRISLTVAHTQLQIKTLASALGNLKTGYRSTVPESPPGKSDREMDGT